MNWSSWSEFFAMGGYGFFVWGAFGMSALAVALEIAQLRVRRRGLHTGDRPGART